MVDAAVDAPAEAPPSRWAIYRELVRAQVRGQLSYRTSFALDCAAQAVGGASELVVILTLFGHIPAMGGFAVEEVVLIYALANLSFSLADLVAGQIERLPAYIRTGLLDAVLVRPLSALGQLFAADLQLRRLARAALALALLVYALFTADLAWSPATVALLVIAPFAGAVIFGSFFVAACSVSFWVIEGGELANSVTYGSNMLTSYPITVFGPWLRRLLAFVVPGAFVAYFPTLALLGRPDPLGLPSFLQWSSPLVAIVAAAVAGLIWRTALRHYRGTGS